MRDALKLPFATKVVCLAAVVLAVGVCLKSSRSAAAPEGQADAEQGKLKATALAQIHVGSWQGGLLVFDSSTGDVYGASLPYNEKAPLTQLGTLRKKDGWTGKWEFVPPGGAAAKANDPAGAKDDNARAEAARKATATATLDLANLSLALAQFEIDTGRYPTTEEGLQALVVQPTTVEMWKGPYAKKGVPKDPWGNPYIYRNPGKAGPKSFDLSSFGPNGTEGGGDDIFAGSTK